VTLRNIPVKVIDLSINEKWTNRERERERDIEEEKVNLSSFSFCLTKKIIQEGFIDPTDFSFLINSYC
jgi:hypothetical protein